MTELAGSGSLYQFGVFELDLQAGELRKRGIRIKLQEQPLQILGLLIGCSGEVVTREHIQQKLWCGETFVDFDNAINSAVRKIRDALGDNSENPRFVETVARRGYRFIAPVNQHVATEAPVQENHLAPPEPAAPSRAPFYWLSGMPWAIAGVALLLAAASYWPRPAREGPQIRSFILPPIHSKFRCEGDEGGPAVLSPDGKRLAFTAPATDGKVLLWVRPLDSATAQPLAGTEGAEFPFWSPNSRSLGFFVGGKLKRIEAAGGTVNVLADGRTSRGGAWNKDDVIVFAPALLSGLVRISASGGAVTPVTRLNEKEREMSHRWPWFLSDGKHFLYTSRGRGVFIASLDVAEAPRRLLTESSNALYSDGFLVYTHASPLLARRFDEARREFAGTAATVAQSINTEQDSDRGCFTASDNGLLAYHSGPGEFQLTWRDRAGNRVGTVGAPGLFRGIDIAPDGERAAGVLTDESGGESVWIYELARGIRAPFSSGARYTGVVWSPDASRVAVGLERDGGFVVYAKEAGGSGEEEVLFQSNFEVGPRNWLHRGLTLMRRDNLKTGWDIYFLPTLEKGLDRPPAPVVRGVANEQGGVVSPDGRWILYLSDESAGLNFEAYVAAFPGGGARRQVSTASADTARWSPNGKEILFSNHTKLMSAAVWAVGDRLEVGTPRVLFEMHVDCYNLELPCFDVAPDGQRFLVFEPTGSPPPVALIQNWTAGLKK